MIWFICLLPTDAASRNWKATCTSNRLTQAHWHRHLMAKLRSGLVVCKSTRENSQHTVGSNLSLFLFNIVTKCTQLNKIDRKLVSSPWCCLIVHIIYFSFALLEKISGCILVIEFEVVGSKNVNNCELSFVFEYKLFPVCDARWFLFLSVLPQ